jgi:hypothetical protein
VPDAKRCYVGNAFLTAVVMKTTILLDVSPCSLLKVNGRFEGTYRLRLHRRRIYRAKKKPL